jgi:glycosyltransferase involved in cell wall biosynthesis
MAEDYLTRPRLSVVIPTHNRLGLLGRVLYGLAAQDYPSNRFEVIVVVDGATDGTAEWLASYRPPYALRVIEQAQGGPARARNAGIEASQGKAVLFLDDDVVPTPRLVGAHARVYEADDRAVVIGRVLPCTAGGDHRPGWEHWEDAMAARDYQRLASGQYQPSGALFYTWNVSVSRACLDQVGGYDPTLAFQEDVDLGFRLQAAGAHFYFGAAAAGYHCGHRPTFASWCRRHYRFGFYRLVMQRRTSGHAWRSLSGSYRDYHPLTRLMLRLAIGQSLVREAISTALRGVAAGLDALHAWQASQPVYSALAVLHYWRGVEDALGDGARLRRLLGTPETAERRLLQVG